jgi:hypothetical protein
MTGGPHVSLVLRESPDFLYAALSEATSAAFIEESRMKFINANKLHRKFGGAPSLLKGAHDPSFARALQAHTSPEPRILSRRFDVT